MAFRSRRMAASEPFHASALAGEDDFGRYASGHFFPRYERLTQNSRMSAWAIRMCSTICQIEWENPDGTAPRSFKGMPLTA
jgi:hypothetical protein